MKLSVLILAAASLASAQTKFATGQAARTVIGQPRFSSQRSDTTQTIIGAAQGLAFANGTLLVADANRQGAYPNNNRVLIFNQISNWMPGVYDSILQNGTSCPICQGLAPNTTPPGGNPWPGASVVLGQSDFNSNCFNMKETDGSAKKSCLYTGTDQVIGADASAQTMRTPVAVAYNGRYVAVADTENNRVLVWKSLPTTNDQPADFVVGQADFKTFMSGSYGKSGLPVGHCTSTSLRAPSGVYIDASDGLWVADTGNNRVLYYGVITQNGQAAKVVLGQSGFDKDTQSVYSPNTTSSSLFAPVGISGDATHLYVADSYQNRVLVWSPVPSANNAAAQVVIGQNDFTSNAANTVTTKTTDKGSTYTVSALCDPTGTTVTSDTKETINVYPAMCAKTLNTPHAVISDGTRLFIADTGNDRVLVYNSIPTTSAPAADVVLGQIKDTVDNTSDSAAQQDVASAGSFKAPNSLAWDGTNLLVADTFNRRVMVFTPGDVQLPLAAVRNAASPFVFARGSMTLSGSVEDAIKITFTVGNDDAYDSTGTAITTDYTYTTKATDTFATIINGIAKAINSANNGSGDKYLYATPDTVANLLIFTAKQPDLDGNKVTIAVKLEPSSSKLSISLSGSKLTGGSDSALMAPFSLVRIMGIDGQEIVPGIDKSKLEPMRKLTTELPFEMAGVEFYVDGVRCPLVSVTPTAIVAQMPIELTHALQPDTETPDSTSVVNVVDVIRYPRTASAYLRFKQADGSYKVSNAMNIPIIAYNPAIFYDKALLPNPGVPFHGSSYATATVSIDGSIQAGDKATLSIRDRDYQYVVQGSDSTQTVRDALTRMIHDYDPEVDATIAGPYARIRLSARIPGPVGNGIPIGVNNNSSSSLIITAFNTALCCAKTAGAPITESDPAVPGETISMYATGLGVLARDADVAQMQNGKPFKGNQVNDITANGFVYCMVGGKTANVLLSGLRQGWVGVYQVDVELNTSLPTDPKTPMSLSQLYQVSNIVYIPVVSQNP